MAFVVIRAGRMFVLSVQGYANKRANGMWQVRLQWPLPVLLTRNV
jgi:hypothetical protein